MVSPGLTSGLVPGGPNSLSAMRPSDFRPTSTMAYSSVRRRMRPVTTEPSKLVSRPRVSSSRDEKSSPLKWSCIGAGAMVRAIVAVDAMWWGCSVTVVPGLSPGVAVGLRVPLGEHVLPAEGRGPGCGQAGMLAKRASLRRDTPGYSEVKHRRTFWQTDTRQPVTRQPVTRLACRALRVPDYRSTVAAKDAVGADDGQVVLARPGNQHAVETRPQNESLERFDDGRDLGPLPDAMLGGDFPGRGGADNDGVARVGD